jgi:hypothetical protein
MSSVRGLLRLAVVVFAGVFALLAPAAAASSCDTSGLRTQERPDPEGVPTHVQLGILVNDVLSVDDVGQAATVDLIAVAQWTDPRLAALSGCRVQKNSVWFPRVEILNSNQLRPLRINLADVVEIGDGGKVRYVQRLNGPISTYHNLARFPFDHHRFKFSIVTFDFPADQVVIDVDDTFTRLGTKQNIADWNVHAASGSSAVEPVDELGATYSVFTLTIDLSRSDTFYIWRLILPMMLIVAMSFGVFWINPERFGPQISLSATAMLTLIAFQFFVAGALPKLSYFTTLDKLIVTATAIVFLTLLQSIYTANLVSRERSELARRIDRRCRWLFPLVFLGAWAAILV